MKKNTRLDTKGFLLMETLLVSLTIAGILLYMYVQYSRISDSYHRLARYNSVENLYRTGDLKRLLVIEDEDSFYATVDAGMTVNGKKIAGVYKLSATNFNGTSTNNPLTDFNVVEAYIIKGNADLASVSSSFSAFLKTIENDDNYRIVVKYNDGSSSYPKNDEFASIILKEV